MNFQKGQSIWGLKVEDDRYTIQRYWVVYVDSLTQTYGVTPNVNTTGSNFFAALSSLSSSDKLLDKDCFATKEEAVQALAALLPLPKQMPFRGYE